MRAKMIGVGVVAVTIAVLCPSPAESRECPSQAEAASQVAKVHALVMDALSDVARRAKRSNASSPDDVVPLQTANSHFDVNCEGGGTFTGKYTVAATEKSETAGATGTYEFSFQQCERGGHRLSGQLAFQHAVLSRADSVIAQTRYTSGELTIVGKIGSTFALRGLEATSTTTTSKPDGGTPSATTALQLDGKAAIDGHAFTFERERVAR